MGSLMVLNVSRELQLTSSPAHVVYSVCSWQLHMGGMNWHATLQQTMQALRRMLVSWLAHQHDEVALLAQPLMLLCRHALWCIWHAFRAVVWSAGREGSQSMPWAATLAGGCTQRNSLKAWVSGVLAPCAINGVLK